MHNHDHGGRTNSTHTHTHRKLLPIVQSLVSAYKLWHEFVPHIAKTQRYSLGGKIDTYFIGVIEATIVAASLVKVEKIPYLVRAVAKLDLLKFFLYVAWDVKALDNNKYLALSEKLDEIGRQLGGWKRQLDQTKKPAPPRGGAG